MAAESEKKWGKAAHIIPLAVNVFSAGLLGWVAAGALFFTVGRRSRFVRLHVVQAMLFSVLLAVVAGLTMAIVPFPLSLLPGAVLWLAGFGFPILGASRAGKGREIALPVAGRISRALVR
jgi:uncharacterized membrane protein